MRERYELLIVFMIVIGTCIGISFGMIMFRDHQSQIIVGEGVVEDLEVKSSGHFLGGVDYWVQLNNSKWYEISQKSYYELEIGMYIIIYKNQKVEIIP